MVMINFVFAVQSKIVNMEVVIGASEDGLINDTIKDCNQVDHHNQTNNQVTNYVGGEIFDFNTE